MTTNRHTNDQAATSKRTRNRLAALMATLTVAGAASVALAGPAVAAGDCANGHFCVYTGPGCTHKLLDSTASPGRIDLNHRAIRGADNNTRNVLIGKVARRGMPDRVAFRSAPHTIDCSFPDGTIVDYIDVR